MMETSTRPEVAGSGMPPPATAAAPDPAPSRDARTEARAITKIVVAIHGIGQQYRSETIRSVARRFGDSCKPALPLLPLGYFNIADGSDVRWSQLETDDPDLSAIGFAELFWADIPSQLVRSNDTLEETKAWARTVVSRAESLYDARVRKAREDGGELEDCDFKQGIDAVDTLAEGVAVIERLCRLAAKAGGPKFEVATLLRDFVGDVQTVTEFPHYRNKILYRFHAALNAIVACFRARYGRDPEIYLVAHSEGTVISLLALLQALSSMTLADPEGKGNAEGGGWVECMHGFMTLGSPIDKHITLWPALWKDFSFTTTKAGNQVTVCSTREGATPVTLRRPIKWRNYFDYGDPVGFRLDEAQHMLARIRCGAFEFERFKHDHGYSRYWWPGKAHVCYWNDAALFRHFIETVVKPSSNAPPGTVPPPGSKPLCDRFAKCVPYVIAFGLHLAAVMTLLSALSLESLRGMSNLAGTALPAIVLSVLLATVTVAARLPRLVRPAPRWGVLALLALMAGVAVTWWWLPAGLASGVGQAYQNLTGSAPASPEQAGKLTLCVAAALTVLAAWIMPRGWARQGRRLLVASGFLLSIGIVVAGRGGLGGVTMGDVAACLPFVFLWWLGIILFDLAFVWHRYIRQAVCVRTLRAWQHNEDAAPDPWWGLGTGKDQKPPVIRQPL